MKPPAKHKTKFIRYKDQEADVDVEIADLVLNLWKLDLATLNSCQDNVPKGFVWIEFASVYDAQTFLDYVAEYSDEPGSLYDRMTRAWGDKTDLDWRYDPLLTDYGVNEEVTNEGAIVSLFTGSHEFNFSMSVRFPHRDLAFVEKRIREALKKA